MPIETECAICGGVVKLMGYDQDGVALWWHYRSPEPYHEAVAAPEIAAAFHE